MDFEHLELEQQHTPGSYAEKPSSSHRKRRHQHKSVNIDLSAIEDHMVREAFNPSGSLSMHEIVERSDVQLTNVANASPTSSERPSAMRTLTPLPLSHITLTTSTRTGRYY
jgi:hypothetical protein